MEKTKQRRQKTRYPAMVLPSSSSSSSTTSAEDYHHHHHHRGDEDFAAVVNGVGTDMVSAVESLLGYTFREPRLLEEALTHPSHQSHPNYQRLEFVGDAALGLAVANHIFLTNPGVGPGRLSLIRAANISTEKLARVAVRHGLYAHLRRNSAHLDVLVGEFSAAVAREEVEEAGFAAVYGGAFVKAPKVLADIVESVAAAVYVDCGFDLEALWQVFRGLLEPIITADTLHDQPVTALNEFCQKHGLSFVIKNWNKCDRNVTQVFVDGKLFGSGCSDQKEIAKLNAARDALRTLLAAATAAADSEVSEMETDISDCGSALVYGGGAEEAEGAKKRLNDLCSKNHWPHPIYRVESEQGPAHYRRFICSVQVQTSDGMCVKTSGDLKSKKKDSENVAASRYLNGLMDGQFRN